MDLPCPEWMKHVEEKWTRLGSAKRESFSLLADIDEIYRYGQSQVKQDDVEVLLRISERYDGNKCAESATRCREQGNRSFKLKDYKSAALYYSKGVSYAGNKTEQLSLCYANRSAALFHLGLYKECLEDIQRALDEGYPSRLQCKLTNRHTQCVNKLQKHELCNASSLKQHTPQTDEKKNSITELSAAVSVHFTPEKGRHLLVAENKSAGEVVVEDEAFSLVLIPSDEQHMKAHVFGTQHIHCHHCLLQTLSPVPCQDCSYACYCGPTCRREAWRQYHRWECPSGSQLLTLGVLAHLALRVALKAGLKEVQRARESHNNSEASNSESGSCGESYLGSLSDCYHGRLYLGIYSLLPHVLQHPPSLRFLLALTMATLCQSMKDVGPETWSCNEQEGGNRHEWPDQSMLGAVALRHMMQLRCNAQAVTAIRDKEDSSLAVQSSREVRLATALFPILSLLNHSCCPNTSISFHLGLSSAEPSSLGSSTPGVAVSIRTCRDVEAGQELLHCYGPHYSRMDVRKRQHLLLEQYFFQCHCDTCALELADGTGTLPSAFSKLRCESCGSSLQMGTDTDVHVCSQSSCPRRTTNTEMQRKLQALRQLLDQALELMEKQRADGALQMLQEATSHADHFLMKTHPLQGELADATARAYASSGEESTLQAAWHLKRSLAAVRSQYGEDSLELGRQLFKLTQLHFNGGDGQSALSVIPLARRLLSLHCDPHCEELEELKDMEACLHGTG
uniref:Protein-lysine N-methyltransferase SMYD4 n=1 Tax=Electrophorus electricus TaxID=8005 RepID=A0A4W4GIG4_ELEEL